MLATQIHRSVC